MSVYGEAIIKLVAQCESKALPDWQLALLMAVIRGPDSEDEELKARYTAPLRLFLLGREAYLVSNYSPSRHNVSRVLPKAPLSTNHYFGHIVSALNIIAAYDLKPADGE